ncbi:MAG TPA: tetratricopeptide repeat protein [Nitrolancea sp.]
MTTGGPPRFGELLRQFRLSATLSQEALAERAGLSVDAVRALERGRRSSPRPDTLAMLFDALDLGPDDRQQLVAAANPTSKNGPRPASRPVRPSRTQALGPLFGREREQMAITDLLLRDDARVVTLLGPGGVGKTRLATAIADAVESEFRHGIIFVDLAPLRTATLVGPTIAQVLGLREVGVNDAEHVLLEFLSVQQLLLVLDNFEHVTAAAGLVGDIRDRCPSVTMLVTSRVPLQLRGEQRVPLQPLAIPSRRDGQYRDVEASAAVHLFVARAQSVQPSFELTPTNLDDVAAICARLDGLPLAIEMAAARIGLLPPKALRKRLTSRLNVLTGGLRDLPPRQRTLRATIDWSYGLLSEAEQRLFRGLSVFAAEWSLDAAEIVCGNETEDAPFVLDLLEGLVDGSLVRLVETEDGEPRYTMLETMREFASERAREVGGTDGLSRRHAGYYLDLAETAEDHLVSAEQTDWLNRLEREHDNLRAALGWTVQSEEAETGLRLAGALWRFWWQRGYLSEGIAWFDQLLKQPQAVSTVVRARALNGAGNLNWTRGDLEKAWRLHTECLALRRELGDEAEIAKSLNNLGLVATYLERESDAVAHFEESLEMHRRIGHQRPIAGVLVNLGELVMQLGDLGRADELIQESLRLYREFGDPRGTADSLHNLGGLAGDLRQFGRARTYLAESVALYAEVGDQHGIASCLQDYAAVLVASGAFERAVWLLGCATHIRATFGGRMTPVELARYERLIDTTRNTLGSDAFDGAMAYGATLPIDEARAMVCA